MNRIIVIIFIISIILLGGVEYSHGNDEKTKFEILNKVTNAKYNILRKEDNDLIRKIDLSLNKKDNASLDEVLKRVSNLKLEVRNHNFYGNYFDYIEGKIELKLGYYQSYDSGKITKIDDLEMPLCVDSLLTKNQGYCINQDYIVYHYCDTVGWYLNYICGFTTPYKIDISKSVVFNTNFIMDNEYIYFKGKKWRVAILGSNNLSLKNKEYSEHYGTNGHMSYFKDENYYYTLTEKILHNGEGIQQYDNSFSIGKNMYISNINGVINQDFKVIGSDSYLLKNLNALGYKTLANNLGYTSKNFIQIIDWTYGFGDTNYSNSGKSVTILEGDFDNLIETSIDNIFSDNNQYIVCTVWNCIRLLKSKKEHNKIIEELEGLLEKINKGSITKGNYKISEFKKFLKFRVDIRFISKLIIKNGKIGPFLNKKIYLKEKVEPIHKQKFFKSKIYDYEGQKSLYYTENNSIYYDAGYVLLEDGTKKRLYLVRSKRINSDDIIDELYFTRFGGTPILLLSISNINIEKINYKKLYKSFILRGMSTSDENFTQMQSE